jgi:hypothetical protein
MPTADLTTPEEEFGSATIGVTNVSREYLAAGTNEPRVAIFGISLTKTGFESWISVYRRNDPGGEPIIELSLPSTTLDAAFRTIEQVLRDRGGMPGGTRSEIAVTDQTSTTKGAGGTLEPRPPTPRDRSHAGPDEARPPSEDIARLTGTGPEPGPASRAETLGPEVPAPPSAIEVPADVADLIDYHLTQFETATESWRVPIETGLRYIMLPGMAPQDWRAGMRSVADVLRIGTGTAEGTAVGVLADANRALSAFPETRGISRIVDVASHITTAAGVAESVASGQGVGAGGVVGIVMIGVGAAMGTTAQSKAKQLAKKLAGKKDPPFIASEGKQPRTITKEEFVKDYVDRAPLTNKERNDIRRRVQELHANLDWRGQTGKTTAIVIARAPDGTLQILVASSEKSLRKQVREKLLPEEIQCPGNKRADPDNPDDHFHHAEVNGINVAVSTGWKVVEIFPSRNACPLCAEMRELLGTVINDPT